MPCRSPRYSASSARLVLGPRDSSGGGGSLAGGPCGAGHPAGELSRTHRPGDQQSSRRGDRLDRVDRADVILLALEPGESPMLPLQTSSDAAHHAPAVLVLGDEPAAAWAGRALRGGALGALPRTASTEQIIRAVLAVAAGLMVREPTPADAAQPIRAGPAASGVQSLTGREIEILALLAEGLGNKAIAGRLGISEHTVKSHLTSIFAKLDVSTRAEAVASAARLGLIML
jgi:two-component system, NarL family, response regulator YdfI